MKKDDFVTPAELNALLGHSYTDLDNEKLETIVPEASAVESDKLVMRSDEAVQEANERTLGLSQSLVEDKPIVDELLQTIHALTDRIEQLEQRLEKEMATRLELSGTMQGYMEDKLEQESSPIPEPGTFSRVESYGKPRKKKKRSFLQKLFS
jgi:hypothetical protein